MRAYGTHQTIFLIVALPQHTAVSLRLTVDCFFLNLRLRRRHLSCRYCKSCQFQCAGIGKVQAGANWSVCFVMRSVSEADFSSPFGRGWVRVRSIATARHRPAGDVLPSPTGRRAGDEGLAVIKFLDQFARDKFASEFISRSVIKIIFVPARPSPNPLPGERA